MLIFTRNIVSFTKEETNTSSVILWLFLFEIVGLGFNLLYIYIQGDIKNKLQLSINFVKQISLFQTLEVHQEESLSYGKQ